MLWARLAGCAFLRFIEAADATACVVKGRFGRSGGAPVASSLCAGPCQRDGELALPHESPAVIAQHVTWIMEAAPEHMVPAVLRMFQAPTEDGLFPVRVGIGLRERGQHAVAEYVFSISRPMASHQPHAMFQLGYSKSQRGDTAGAIAALEEAVDHPQATTEHLLCLAREYGRAGRRLDAAGCVDRAFAMDPALLSECRATLEFADYLAAWPPATAQRLLQDVRERHAYKESAEIEEEIVAALESGSPYALIRLGDGEGSSLPLPVEEETRFTSLYARCRRSFMTEFFGEGLDPDSPDFVRLRQELLEVVEQADCLGTPYQGWVDVAYRSNDMRGVPTLVNCLRAVDGLVPRPGRTVCSQLIGYDLLIRGILDRLLAGRHEIGLVSRHQALPDRLRERYGIATVHYHAVPAESVNGVATGGQGAHFPRRYVELRSELEAPPRPGVLYLVAAGLLGKMYCLSLRRAGAVAIDIGSTADYWMGEATRALSPDLQRSLLDHALA